MTGNNSKPIEFTMRPGEQVERRVDNPPQQPAANHMSSEDAEYNLDQISKMPSVYINTFAVFGYGALFKLVLAEHAKTPSRADPRGVFLMQPDMMRSMGHALIECAARWQPPEEGQGIADEPTGTAQ
jgi:hypothetical protein